MSGGVPRAIRLTLVELASGPLAWRRLPEVTGLTDELTDLVSAGLVDVWELEEPLATLTPFAASLLGLHLVEGPFSQAPHWAPIDQPEPPQVERRRHSISEPEPHPDPYRRLLPREPEPTEAIDPVTESPLELLGVRVLIDRRLSRAHRGRSARKAP